MNTVIESPEINIDLGITQLVQHYAKPASFKPLMPSEVKKFEADEQSFVFALSGMPEVKLNVEEISEKQVMLKSASDKLPFYLRVKFNAVSENTTKARIHFEGDFNPMLKMMVNRPLKNFINHLADNMSKLH